VPVRARKPRRTRQVVVCAGAALLFVGCTGGAPSPPADQPAASGGTFEAGAFADLPKPPSAAPFDDPVIQGSTIVQSFEVAGSSPAQILGFYENVLPQDGWTVSTAPAATGATDWTGNWMQGDVLLEVSASPSVGDGGPGAGGGITSQVDLVLTP
jgi:hypothetical protein